MSIATGLRYVLAAEFLLGGQARLTPWLTPSIHNFVMSKSRMFFQHLKLIPGNSPQQQMQVTGAVMCIASVWLVLPIRSSIIRRGALLLAGLLSTTLLVGEYTIGGDVYLPAVNIALAGWLLSVDISTRA